MHGAAELLSLRSSERGLKLYGEEFEYTPEFVAPFVGAWIEIATVQADTITVKSLRSSERGLK